MTKRQQAQAAALETLEQAKANYAAAVALPRTAANTDATIRAWNLQEAAHAAAVAAGALKKRTVSSWSSRAGARQAAESRALHARR